MFSHGNFASASYCAATGATSSRANCADHLAHREVLLGEVERVVHVRQAASVSSEVRTSVRNRSPYLSIFIGPTPRISPSAYADFGRRTRDLEQRPVGEDDVRRHLSSRAMLVRNARSCSRSARIGADSRRARTARASVGRTFAANAALLARLAACDAVFSRRVASWVPRQLSHPPQSVPRRGIAEVAQHEPAPAAVRVRVLLHRVELGEIGLATALDRRPVDRIRGERSPRVGDAVAAAESRPTEELRATGAPSSSGIALTAPPKPGGSPSRSTAAPSLSASPPTRQSARRRPSSSVAIARPARA